MTESFPQRLLRISGQIKLGMRCNLIIGHEEDVYDLDGNDRGRYFFQISCYRLDAITGEEGRGKGGKAYLSEHMTDSELVQVAFGLYKSYWEHEARETFQWKDRRVFGPHISTEALWEVARRVDVRSARHEEDRK